MVETVHPDQHALEPLTDEELCALALAADPDAEVADDAVSLWDLTGTEDAGSLPAWYMPAAAGGRLLHGWRRVPPVLVIAAFLVINCYGLCNTYGQLGFS
jgi:hypothetical protein